MGLRQKPHVLKGAKLLDDKHPGWEKVVDIKQLTSVAVLGGLSLLAMIYESDYDEAYESLGLTSLKDQMEHGFEVYDPGLLEIGPEDPWAKSEDWAALARLWKEQVELRLAKNSTKGE